MARRKRFKIEGSLRFDRPLCLKVIHYYIEGYDLRELCYVFDTDISTILEILKKKKFKKKKLYDVYRNQEDRKELGKTVHIFEKEENLLEKYFPLFSNSEFSHSYFWYWKEKRKDIEKKKERCTHKYRHIRCSVCSKILGDASNIKLPDETCTS